MKVTAEKKLSKRNVACAIYQAPKKFGFSKYRHDMPRHAVACHGHCHDMPRTYRSHNTQDQEVAMNEVGPHPAGKQKYKKLTLSSD